MENLRGINIGGINIGLIDQGYNRRFLHEDRFSEFKISGPPDVTLRFYCGDIPAIEENEPVFDTGFGWRIYRSKGNFVFECRLPDGTRSHLAVIQPDFRSGKVYVIRDIQDPSKFFHPFGYPFGEVFTSHLLGRGYGVMLHACGVIDGERGYAFAGFGDSGKSTMAGLWAKFPNARVINDDRVILRRINDGFIMYGTPWHGIGGTASPDHIPLQRLYILEQCPNNFVEPLGAAEAVSQIFARSFPPIWDTKGTSFTLGFLEEMSREIPCFRLGFVPDESAVEYVQCQM